MGQKVHPLGFRLGVYRDWNARWFARGREYGSSLMEDLKIRKYLDKELAHAEVARVEIEKAVDNIRVIVHSARPGIMIGKKGQEIDRLRLAIGKLTGKKNIEISVQEVKKPDFDATLLAKSIASQIESRVSYKRAMKKAATSAMREGALGIKICTAGRLNGAEIARTEWTRIGSVPLHTLRSDIDYGFVEAKTTYGIIGIKVWLCKGDFKIT